LSAGENEVRTSTEPDLRLSVDGLRANGRIYQFAGTVADLAAQASLSAIRPDVEYHDQISGDAQTKLTATPAANAQVLTVFTIGAEAMAAFSDVKAILWPEHFDFAIRVDEVNYGISPGDGYWPQPYAYLGPNEVGHDPFWNAPFGAVHPMDPSDPDAAATTQAFLRAGRDTLVG
jgi:hypothetical protein